MESRRSLLAVALICLTSAILIAFIPRCTAGPVSVGATITPTASVPPPTPTETRAPTRTPAPVISPTHTPTALPTIVPSITPSPTISAPVILPATGGHLSQPDLNVSYHFNPGLNYIALAVRPAEAMTASDLLEAIAAQGGNAAWVTRWVNGGWDTHVRGLPFNDFSIEIGRGYFVFADASSDFVLVGRAIHVAPPLSLVVRWTSVGLPTWDGKSSEQVLRRLRVCPEMRRWNGADWDVYLRGGPDPFKIDAREGYFIACDQRVEP
jgi:hypothetical protein